MNNVWKSRKQGVVCRRLCVLFLAVLMTAGAALAAGCGGGEGSSGNAAETSGSAAETSGSAAETSGSAAETSGSSAATGAEAEQDAVFEPASFTWSGGTGKIEMTCPEVRTEDGKAYATIRISSPHYTWLKVDGTEYEGEHGEDYSEFEIPVVLDQDMEISGQTTAMSQPHEVSYTIHISTQDSGSAESGTAPGSAPGASGDAADGTGDPDEQAGTADAAVDEARKAGPPEIAGLTFERAMDPEYAECFNVFYYQDGYKLLDIYGRGRYLLIPEGKDVPEGVQAAEGSPFGTLAGAQESVVILRQVPERIYLAATAVMSLFDGIGETDRIRLTGTAQSGWYLDAPVKALDAGEMIYAGKYSEPDYELLVGESCDLAIESTMILHTPEVQEKIEELGIPVLTDYSSYEDHPLGRAEWIRFYGALTGREDAAKAYFSEQKKVMEAQKEYEPAGSTVAVFFISDDGRVAVRRPDDYLVQMIEIAGGTYAFADLGEASGGSTTVSLSMEEFYDKAVDADYLIYNATITDAPKDLADLLGKSELLADFKAVQEGKVWTTEKSLYQETGRIAQFIPDVHAILTGDPDTQLTFLRHVE